MCKTKQRKVVGRIMESSGMNWLINASTLPKSAVLSSHLPETTKKTIRSFIHSRIIPESAKKR